MRLAAAILIALTLLVTEPPKPAPPSAGVPDKQPRVEASLRGRVLTVTWEGGARACVTRGTHGYPLGCGDSPLTLLPLDSGLLVQAGERVEVRDGERVIGAAVVPWVVLLPLAGVAP